MRRVFVFTIALLLLASFVNICDARVLVRDDKSVVKVGEDINMGEAMQFKDLVAVRGNINVKGDVANDVVAVLGNIHLFPTAKVGGDVVAIGGTITRYAGSLVKGDIVEMTISKEGMNFMAAAAPVVTFMSIGGFIMMKLLVLLGFIGIAIMVTSFLTRQIGAISANVEKQWLKSLLWGALGSLLICPIAFLLAITIVGIPLILIEILLVSVAMTMGYLAVTQLIGKRFTKAIRKPNQPMLVEVVWGLVILFLIDLIPFVGFMVKWALVTMGFGSAVITKLGTKS